MLENNSSEMDIAKITGLTIEEVKAYSNGK